MILSRMARRRAKVWALSTVGATALASVSVTTTQAQDVEPATIDSVVVTGTRITRDGYEAPTPVSVLGADELNALNTVNVADAVNVLPAFSNSVSPRSANGNLSTGATGVSQLNLRGMGTNRTLVLLDGKRYINAALTSGNSAPDINSFPNALIERVDVVTGGASAAYGSDALSGVVNFVIDHDFTGFKGEVQTGMTKYEDDKSISAQLSYGTPFADGRGHLLMSGEYTKSEGIEGTNDRPWARLPAAVILNPAYAAGNGQPRYVVRRDVGLSAGTPGGIITTGPLRGTYFGPNGEINRNFNFGTNVGNNFQEGGDWQYSRIENGLDISGEVERAIGYVRTSYDLTDNVSAYLEGQYSDTSTTNVANPNRRLGNNTVSINNAFLPASLRQEMINAGVNPATGTFTMGSTNADMGRLVGDYSRSLYRIAGGLDGSFGALGTDWTWNTYVQHSETD
ncbi:MAG TPA: TonB-dependent receptor plug domain-containing protein, partial [Steroidobacter sp.]